MAIAGPAVAVSATGEQLALGPPGAPGKQGPPGAQGLQGPEGPAGSGGTQGTIPLANGLNSDVALATVSSIRFDTYTGAVILGGMAISPAPTAGVPFDVEFTVAGQQVTIRDSDASSSVGNRILTGTGADVVLPIGQKPRARFVRTVVAGVSTYNLQSTGVHQEDVVNVRNFYRAGDTDDTAAIVRAIAAVTPLGGEVVIPQGGYAISSMISVPESVTIQGRGSPWNLANSTYIKATAPMAALFSTSGVTQLRNMLLDANQQATECVERAGDSQSEYHRVWCVNGLRDGFHSAAITGVTLSAITPHVGNTSPLVSVSGLPQPIGFSGTWTVTVTSTGGLGAGIVSVAVPGLGTVAGLTIPAAGPGGSGRLSVPESATAASAIALGVLLTFPAGTYTSGDSWTFTVAATRCINDQARFHDCQAIGCGTVYCTAGFTSGSTGGQTADQFNFRSVRFSATLAGSIAKSIGSPVLTGTGTSFISQGARPGDIVRVGAYPSWQSGTSYPGSTLITGNAFTGQAYVWSSSGGTSGGTEPSWPMFGAGPGGSPIGSTIGDNGITWTCVDLLFFQILNVLDDHHIQIQADGVPRTNDSGLDYALCIGSGFFEELSSDANTSIIDGGVYNSNACFGVMSLAAYGDKLVHGQTTNNGVGGLSLGIASNGSYDPVGFCTYMEGNLCANVFIAYATGVDLFHIIQQATNCPPFVSTGNPNTTGLYRGAGIDHPLTLVELPIGSSSYSSVPALNLSGASPLEIPQSLYYAIGNAQQLTTAPTQIVPNGGIIEIEVFSNLVLTGTPTILTAGVKPGTWLRLANYSAPSVTFQDRGVLSSSALVLDGPTITLNIRDQVDFWFDGNYWVQAGPVHHVGNQAIPGFSLGLTAGTNTDVPNPGVEAQEIADLGAAFTLTGIVAGYNGQIFDIAYYGTNAAHTFTLVDQATSAAANQIMTPTTGIDLVLTPGTGGVNRVRLRYSTLKSKWVVLASE